MREWPGGAQQSGFPEYRIRKREEHLDFQTIRPPWATLAALPEPLTIAQVTPYPWEDEHEVNAFVRALAAV